MRSNKIDGQKQSYRLFAFIKRDRAANYNTDRKSLTLMTKLQTGEQLEKTQMQLEKPQIQSGKAQLQPEIAHVQPEIAQMKYKESSYGSDFKEHNQSSNIVYIKLVDNRRSVKKK